MTAELLATFAQSSWPEEPAGGRVAGSAPAGAPSIDLAARLRELW
jgi:hypothetical protein